MTSVPNCRFCATPLTTTLCDLGAQPLANDYRLPDEKSPERSFPLHARVCPSCLLVQVDDSVPPDAIFSDYAYFSSYSDSWVAHAKRYAEATIERFDLGPEALVVEIASNDGYLLQHFKAAGVPVLGVEPAANVAETARAKGIETEVAFFGVETAKRLAAQGRRADLMAANNVLAHVPDIRDFVGGFAALLKPEGVVTFEFPHVLNLIEKVQFDTIYHEHFSYLSLVTVEKVFAAAGLRAIDVEELPTHGGSLRLYAAPAASGRQASPRLDALRAKEHAAGLDTLAGYEGFAAKVAEVKRGFLAFLAGAKAAGRKVAAYGAAAKGNTFLNFCGATPADIVAVFDRSLAKQGRLLPGSGIAILPPEKIPEIAPDYLVILPWNIADEVTAQTRALMPPQSRFVTAVPRIEITPVNFRATRIPGCFLIEPEPRQDDRGFFARLYCPDEFASAGIDFTPVQTNLSRNDRAYTLRGMHFQDPPFAEAKLLHAARGAIFDAVVDLRPESPTYRQWLGFELTADNAHQLFVPEGCAHGFLTLRAETDVLYDMGRKYVPGHARGYRFDDAAFGIDWPHAPASISPADLAWPPFPG